MPANPAAKKVAARVLEFYRISFDSSSSRYVVHYSRSKINLEPMCGSRNDRGRKYKLTPGQHVNCTKCSTKKNRLMQESALAAIAANAEPPKKRVVIGVAKAKAKKATQPFILPPVIVPPDAPIPAQRTNGTKPAVANPVFQAPAPPPPALADELDLDDEFDDDLDGDEDAAPDTATEPAAEEAPQMTAPTTAAAAPAVTPLTAFPKPPVAPPVMDAPSAPVVVAPVASPQPEPEAAVPQPPVEDDVIVERSNRYEVTLTHPDTRQSLTVNVEAGSEDEAEGLALEYLEIEIVTRSVRLRGARRR